LSPGSYREHLVRVVGAIATHGRAVILGRGAHLILDPHRALRVLVAAPLAARVREVAHRCGLSEREARAMIQRVERERNGFLAQHFRAEAGDVTTFDLVVNTGALGIEGAIETVCGAAAALPREAPPTREPIATLV
jgi:cytidylate kinase